MNGREFMQAITILAGGWEPVHSEMNYTALYTSCGLTLLHAVESGSYQGDGHVLVYALGFGLYGYGSYGYGSCSGCDALRGGDPKEVRRELFNGIVWQDNRDNMLRWLREHDWTADYSYHTGDTSKFVMDAIKAVEEHAP